MVLDEPESEGAVVEDVVVKVVFVYLVVLEDVGGEVWMVTMSELFVVEVA